MNITSKGQVTIPQRIRNRFGLKPGTAVEFVAEGNRVIIQRRKKGKSTVDAWLAEATGFLRTDKSTDELMQLTRGED